MTTTPLQQPSLREKFEAWARDNIGQFSRVGHHGRDGVWVYSHNWQQSVWSAYQDWDRRTALSDRPAPEPAAPAMDEAQLQEFCIGLSFEQDDYTVEVIRAVENRMRGLSNFVPALYPDDDLSALATPPEPVVVAALTDEQIDEMVTAYLAANDAYWRRTDEMPKPVGKWRTGTPREATRESLRAALSTLPPPAGGETKPTDAVHSVEAPATLSDAANVSESLAIAALRYYRDECSGAEPSISVFHRMLDEALAPQQCCHRWPHDGPCTTTLVLTGGVCKS